MPIFGERVRVRARIHTVGGLSAHADQEGLAEWYGALSKRPPVWLVHGEERAREGLARALAERFGAVVHRPAAGERIRLA
ncbi:MAG: MBL fold metallo-hydrolase RNA specificity domain-containing protein [Xanthomonadales bacterium]|nr:MBL fold metallo-hydrolase RNA specificity domain-containing protein [Xanthomonadales bacterium]